MKSARACIKSWSRQVATVSNYANAFATRRDVAALVRPPNREPISQSARRLLYVEQSGSMVPWDGDLVPYMHEPMDCLKSRKYDAVCFVGPARTAKTVSLVDAWVCDTAVNDPADMLVVQISQDKAAEYSKKRLSREFDASPEIKAALSPRAHDNNVHDKIFRAGHFLKIGWPSKNIFASSDWRRVAITDYDRLDANIGGEGSAYYLASKRTQTFMSSGMVLVESSPAFPVTDPTYRVASAHEAPPTQGIMSIYNEGDRRLLYWQCPECGEWFEPDFPLLQWDENEPDPAKASLDVVMGCPCCGGVIREDQKDKSGEAFKLRANAAAIWVPEGCDIDQDGRLIGDPRVSRIASFWQKGPTAAFQTWNQLVYKYLAAFQAYEKTGSVYDLQTTVNTDQGKPFVPPRDQEVSANDFSDRKADLGGRVVPPWVRFMVASIDVQGGAKTARFEVQVTGFGRELESVVIDRFNIQRSRVSDPDDPDKFVRVSPATRLEDWNLITEKVIKKTYPIDDGSGRYMPIMITACDSGGEDGVTDAAYKYYRHLKTLNLHRRFQLVKGRGSGAIVDVRYPDNTKRNDRKASALGDVPVLFLNTDRIKDVVFAALNRVERGWRYCHFPDWLPESFFDELVAEERNTSGKWEKISRGVRNESFDLYVYAWAILYEKKADQIDWDKPPPWAVELERSGEILANEHEEIAAPKRRRRRSSV